MDFETMQKVVDGAPELTTHYRDGRYYEEWFPGKWTVFDGSQWQDCKKPKGVLINLADLRAELDKREPMELRDVDIPHGTIVLEK